MTTPEAEEQQSADLTWGPTSYEHALIWPRKPDKGARYPRRAVMMPKSSLRDLFALIDSDQTSLSSASQAATDRFEQFHDYANQERKAPGKYIVGGARVATMGAATAALFLSPLATPIAVGATVAWASGWFITRAAVMKGWLATDAERAEQAAKQGIRRSRVPLHKYHSHGMSKEALFSWSPRFSRVFWWTFLFATSPVGFAFETLNRVRHNQGLRARKHQLSTSQDEITTAEQTRKQRIEALIRQASVGLAVEVPANEKADFEAFNRAHTQAHQEPATVGAPDDPSRGRKRGRSSGNDPGLT